MKHCTVAWCRHCGHLTCSFVGIFFTWTASFMVLVSLLVSAGGAVSKLLTMRLNLTFSESSPGSQGNQVLRWFFRSALEALFSSGPHLGPHQEINET